MAKDVTGQPWIFDATTQAEGVGNSGVFQHPIYIQRVKIDTGNGGDVLVLSASGGKTIIKADNTPADDTLEWPIGAFVRGFYVSTLPTNAQLHVFHGPSVTL